MNLTIVESGGPGTAPRHFTLQCDPAGGNLPDATTACDKLLRLKDIFRPQVGHVMCPNIMGAGRGYIVSGLFLGQTVHQTIIDGGCSLEKWSELNKIFR